MEKFKSFYDILEESLKGKRIKLRSYHIDGYNSFIHKNEKVVGWNEEADFHEWSGVVKKILQNDNSHVDIIFYKNKPRTKSSPELLDDCYNWHMGDYIEILN